MYGTSSLNASGQRVALLDLEGVRVVDAPWLLSQGDANLARYARADQQMRYAPELERLYALGIDAFRLALELSQGRQNVEIDGATGTLSLRGTTIDRRARPATIRDGIAVPDTAP